MRKKILRACIFVFLFIGLTSPSVFSGSVIIFGDSQVDEAAQRQVARAVLTKKPSVIFRVGDLVDNGNSPAQWRLFNDINAGLLKTARYYPALGNHENNSSLYFDNFPFLHNRKWYSVEYEGVHFIVLDSSSDLGRGSAQYAWLESDLRGIGQDIKFKIVLLHHPLFSVGGHEEDSRNLKAALLPLLEKYGVSALFSGHDHNYQRLLFRGIYYIVTGGGGSALRERTRTSPYLQVFKKVYHFCMLTKSDSVLSVRVFDSNLRMIDKFSISGGRKVRSRLQKTALSF